MANKYYSVNDLENILIEMASYLKGCDADEKEQYLQEIAQCGLFHDAIGKVVDVTKRTIVITEEY